MSSFVATVLRGRKCSVKPGADEDGRVDLGAFSTVDCDEFRPDIDKPRYKSNILKEEKEDALLTINMFKERIKKKGKFNTKSCERFFTWFGSGKLKSAMSVIGISGSWPGIACG